MIRLTCLSVYLSICLSRVQLKSISKYFSYMGPLIDPDWVHNNHPYSFVHMRSLGAFLNIVGTPNQFLIIFLHEGREKSRSPTSDDSLVPKNRGKFPFQAIFVGFYRFERTTSLNFLKFFYFSSQIPPKTYMSVKRSQSCHLQITRLPIFLRYYIGSY